MPSFLTAAQLKAMALPVTDKQWVKVTDTEINDKIAIASQHVEDYLDRVILLSTFTQRIVGTGRYTLMLEQYPLRTLISVTANDIYENAESYATSDFLIHGGSGILEFVDKSRNAFYKSRVWVVSYTAGFDTVPGPIRQATALQTIELLQPLFRGGSDFTEVELIDELNESIVDLLEYYKRKRIG